MHILLGKWRPLLLSLMGRINAIKIMILPKFLYLFETLPVMVPLRVFLKLQADLLNFIWAYRWQRLHRGLLFASRSQGGLGVPDLHKYYLAAHLRVLASWVTPRSFNRWTELEKLWIPLIHPNSWLWNSKITPVSSTLLAPMLFAYNIWKSASKRFGLTSPNMIIWSSGKGLWVENCPCQFGESYGHEHKKALYVL